MAEIKVEDFKPNSHKYKQEQELKAPMGETETPVKKVTKVAVGSGTKKKRSLGRRFIELFIDENVGDVKTYLIYDVMVPAIKENMADLINSAVGMLLFGEAIRRVPRRNGANGNSKVNYNGYFNGGQRAERMPSYSRSRIAHDFENVSFESRGDATLVLDGMLEILEHYPQVTVADFYDLAGVSTEFTDNKYGWTNLSGAHVMGSPSRGYYLQLPRCVALE